MKKCAAVWLGLLLACCMGLGAQQITKFAVVDTARVYQAHFRNSSPVRNYENKKQEFQNEINSLTQELQTLHDQKLEFQRNGDDASAERIQAEITKKTSYLSEYTSAKNAELESLKNSLQNNDAFYKKLYATLERVAETGGYSLVLSLQQANAVLWYSPSVDITDEVISQLGL
ncbi:MAG TPA: hypothetical protein DDW78_04255 [Treponema sp.]|nr:hypothetical protein [Treponema sp.]